MADDAKQAAWKHRCQKLQALGVDTYMPTVSTDDPRYDDVQSILAEYNAVLTTRPSLPSGWEGPPPLQPLDNLAAVAEWLKNEWTVVFAIEMGGMKYHGDALARANQTVRNLFRVIGELGVEDQPACPLPAETLTQAKKQIDDLERWVRRKVKEGWKPPLKKAPTSARRPKRNEIPDDYKANIQIKKYLESHPQATIREVAREVGLSIGKVSKLDAWRLVMAKRKAARPVPKKSERPLTDKILQTRGQKDDPAAKLMKDEAIWQWLLDRAMPNERAKLHMKNAEERASLIELTREQYEKEHDDD